MKDCYLDLIKLERLFRYDCSNDYPRPEIPEDSNQIAQDLRTCKQLDNYRL